MYFVNLEILLTKHHYFYVTLLMFAYLLFNKLILLRCPGNASQWSRRNGNKIKTSFYIFMKNNNTYVLFCFLQFYFLQLIVHNIKKISLLHF